MSRVIRLLLLTILLAGCAANSDSFRAGDAPGLASVSAVADARAAFARAYGDYRNGNLQSALPAFTALVTSYPALADHHLYFAGSINRKLQHEDRAERQLEQLLDTYPESIHAPRAALEMGEMLVQVGRLDKARAVLYRAVSAPDSATARAARLALATANERAGDLNTAYEGYMDVRRVAPTSAEGRTAKQQVLALRQENAWLEPTGPARLDEAHLLLAEGDDRGAEALANQIVLRPEGADVANAMRVQADAAYALGNLEGALKALWGLADQYPDHNAAPPALFRMATILWNKDRDSAARRAFEEFLDKFPQNAKAPDALYAIGRIYHSSGNTDAALTTFADLARRFPEHALAGEARWRIGWIYYRDRQWPAAEAAFAELAKHATDRERDEAEYWRARALDHLGRGGPAIDLYRDITRRNPAGYYALWAQRRLNGRSAGSFAFTPSAPVTAPAPPAAPNAGPSGETFHSTRWAELHAAGVDRLARRELDAIRRAAGEDPETVRFLIAAYATVDGFAPASRLAQQVGPKAGLSAEERDRAAYPLAFWPIVERESTLQALDPLLVIGLIRQESRFDPEARSSADARGLMQLLPATAQRVAAADQLSADAEHLDDPRVNIELGTRYLRSLVTRFKGDPLKALAAYNGGEAAVEKWEQRAPDLDPDEFVENIGYRETRDYVKKVVANYRKYQSVYRGDPR